MATKIVDLSMNTESDPSPLMNVTITHLDHAAGALEDQKHYDIDPVAEKALDLIFILHVDHEQNASTSTVPPRRVDPPASRTVTAPLRNSPDARPPEEVSENSEAETSKLPPT